MLTRLRYILKETLTNLSRNLTLTLASFTTVFVSLSLFGVSNLIRYAAANQLQIWKNGVEVSIFMNPDADQGQVDAVERALKDNSLVKSFKFVTKEQAKEELKSLFPNAPEIAEITKLEELPTSFRVVPQSTDSASIGTITAQFKQSPGVNLVRSADAAIAFIRRVSRLLQWGSIVVGAVLLPVAVLLIWNTIRTAMFARRREIEVMKLVGAHNWFIRWPFVLEGMIQGVIGAVVAVGLVWFGQRTWKTKVLAGFDKQVTLDNLQATAGQFRSTAIVLLLVGTLAGAVASAVAATRFLDV
jgi:cell division transport system permease protein